MKGHLEWEKEIRRAGDRIQPWGTFPWGGQAVRQGQKNWEEPVSEVERTRKGWLIKTREEHLCRRRSGQTWHILLRGQVRWAQSLFLLCQDWVVSGDRGWWNLTKWDGQRIEGNKWRQWLWKFWEVLLWKGVEDLGEVFIVVRSGDVKVCLCVNENNPVQEEKVIIPEKENNWQR